MFMFKALLWLDSFYFTIFLKLQMSCPNLGKIPRRGKGIAVWARVASAGEGGEKKVRVLPSAPQGHVIGLKVGVVPSRLPWQSASQSPARWCWKLSQVMSKCRCWVFPPH